MAPKPRGRQNHANSQRSNKTNLQELKNDEKIPITNQFLTIPCVRCGDNSHPGLDCLNTATDHNAGPYGSLVPGKKLGADKWIDELKKRYAERPKDLMFAGAIAKREEQDRENAALGKQTTDDKKGTKKMGQEQQGGNASLADSTRQSAVQGLSLAPANQSSDRKATGPQNTSSSSEPVATYSFDHDRSEVTARRAPIANDLSENFLEPERDTTLLDLKGLKGQQLDYPARTEFTQHRPSTTLLTNHFQLNRNTRVVLYEFKVPELVGKGKRKARAMMKSIVANFPVLRNRQACFATDYFTTIVSWEDLRTHMHNAGHHSISSQGEAEQYRLLTFSDGPTTLRYERKFNMGELFDYANMHPRLPANTNIKPMIDAFNMIISKCVEQSNVATVPGGANKFYLKDAHVQLGTTISLCTHRGYSYSVKAGSGVVLLNVNSLTSAFWCPITLDRAMNDQPFQNMAWNIFEGAIQGLWVYITYDRGDKKKDPEAYARLNSPEARIKPIAGIGGIPTAVEFTPKGGKRTKVMDYFNATYHTGFIKQSDLPLVNLGARDDPRWYPAEKLQILAYQKYKGLVPSILTRNMLDTACQKPPVAKALVGIEGLQALGWTAASQARNQPGTQAGYQAPEFVLPGCALFSLRPALLQVKSGTLAFPVVLYQNNVTKTPQNGRWRFDGVKFYKRNTATFDIFVLHESSLLSNHVSTIFTNISDWTGKNYGVAIVKEAARRNLENLGHETIDSSIQAQKDTGKHANMAMLMLNRKDVAGYSAFKDLCDRKFGLHSLCVTRPPPNKINDGDRWGNVTLKMNLKAAGSNHTIANGLISRGFMAKTLVLGADVTHPGPGAVPGCPSIAAIVGSVDAHAGRFLGSMRLQKESRKEIIDEVRAMVGERITDWIEAMTPRGQQYVTLPQRIIYYRDGVSESQYDQVVLHELSTFGMAFNDVVTELANKKRVDPKASVTNPIIVAVVCGKRHHVRFYPLNAQSADRCDNCHPGTTVDDIVTSPYYQDFYLQSHAAMKGTARPAHYFVVRNDDNTSVANLRSFTHELCYTYVRAPVGVSYASPAYYADRLCERGRCYLRSFFVAPKHTTVRDDFDALKGKLERQIKAAREKDFPPPPKTEQKPTARQPKSDKLVTRQETDRKKLQDACDKHVMAKARDEFERYNKGGNPWHPNVSKTMFWM